MKVIYFTGASSDYAAKCMVELLRLSNKYPKGVVRLEFGDALNGPWDIAVVKMTAKDSIADLPDGAQWFSVWLPSFKEIFLKVESLAKEHKLI